MLNNRNSRQSPKRVPRQAKGQARHAKDAAPPAASAQPTTTKGTKASPPPAALIMGFVDKLSDGMIEGWALDRHDLSRSLQVQAVLNGREIGAAVCNLYREELYKSGAGSGRYGFQISHRETNEEIAHVSVVVMADPPHTLPFSAAAVAELRAAGSRPTAPATVPDGPVAATPMPVTPPPAAKSLPVSVATELVAGLGQIQAQIGQVAQAVQMASAALQAAGAPRQAVKELQAAGAQLVFTPPDPASLPWEARQYLHLLARAVRN
jgi:hypothetical protein